MKSLVHGRGPRTLLLLSHLEQRWRQVLVTWLLGAGGRGRAVGSKFIQLVLKSRSFLLGPGASLRSVGKRLCIYVNPTLSLSSKPSSPNYLRAMKNESAGHTAPRATFQVTETYITVKQDIKTCPGPAGLMFMPWENTLPCGSLKSQHCLPSCFLLWNQSDVSSKLSCLFFNS